MGDAAREDAGREDGGESCADEDGDGYSAGPGCELVELDCDDESPAIHPDAEETCDGEDNDCDGSTDEDVEAPSCALTDGVCAGSTQHCGASGFEECDASTYGADFEEVESRCDGMDNDCDGSTDETCGCTPGTTQACGSDEGACRAGTQRCPSDGSAWGACEGEIGPMGESCDGQDNDCDATTDEPAELLAPDCPLTTGVCAGSHRRCGGMSGWLACTGTESYGAGFEAVETRCDGLDNDCDGATDESCTCVTGDTRPCGSDVGACVGGTQTCTAGSWGACAGEMGPVAETCDGQDNDCDGMTDETLLAPACALTAGVCAGTSQTCGGASSWLACAGTASYGPRYQATETTCDGFDNDCDGTTDEGCTCVVGATQPCGISTGACEPGTQTCGSTGWGACMGAVGPTTETCNGADDDCNGRTDDGLTPPACALSAGVCSGSRQICGGAAGWQACTPASYGPTYAAAETGSTNEALCDGLDNDCDGTVDETCASGPLVTGSDDAISPWVYANYVVYTANPGGNWDVFLYDLRTGASERLTTTPANEWSPRVYGNVVVFERGEGTASRVIMRDLVSGTERALTAAESHSPVVFQHLVLWTDHRGASSDVYAYNLSSSSEIPIATTVANEEAPEMRGNQILYSSDAGGTVWRLHRVDVAAATDTTLFPASTANQINARADWSVLGWIDSRNAVPPLDEFANWDIFGALDTTPSTAVPVTNATGAQLLSGVDGAIFVWSDYRGGNWNIGVRAWGATADTIITSSTAHQGDPSISGDIVVWLDNRLGSFDIYGAALTPITVARAGEVKINEVLADPPTGADVNGDGVASTTDDELVELVNAVDIAVDISGFTLSDAVGTRHVFPAGSTIPAGGALVVFAGGTPRGRFGGVTVETASTGQIGLTNTGDTVTLRTATGTVIDTMTYGSEGGLDDSLVRSPEYTGAFVRHSTLVTGVRYSPGTLVDGYGF